MRTPHPSIHRRRAGVALGAIVAAFAACGEHTAHFGPTADDAAMAAIARAWSEPAGLALSLCEDVARSQAWTGPDGCQVDHVVRGGGLGLEHSETHADGCGAGGCPYRVLAYVRGTAEGAGLPAPAAVAGTVELQSWRADDPYAHPYTLTLSCTDPASPCGIAGTLGADGAIDAVLTLGAPGPGAPETHHALAPAGAATCP